ncbi:MAG: CinA family protein [Alphaproteobacteria bacterium]|nr:CinA family protein [Alphaproteobacteria bacterium]
MSAQTSARLAASLLVLARKSDLKIACAESCTGGMLSAALTELAGSSDMFDRGFITYSNQAKQQMLGVSAQSLERFGAVSEEVAGEMAAGALARSNADIAVSITGIAEPGGSAHKPEGRVCFGLVARGLAPRSETVEFGALGRAQVREWATEHALNLLNSQLKTS